MEWRSANQSLEQNFIDKNLQNQLWSSTDLAQTQMTNIQMQSTCTVAAKQPLSNYRSVSFFIVNKLKIIKLFYRKTKSNLTWI